MGQLHLETSLEAIHLYQESCSASFRLAEIADYLKTWLPNVAILAHEEFIKHHAIGTLHGKQNRDISWLAERFARIKIRDLRNKNCDSVPLPAEIAYEKKRLLSFQKQPFGILYDGEKFLAVYNQLLPEKDRAIHILHIVFTNQLLGTWNPDDRQFHARTSIYGIPCLISTTGLIEAPAKPRQYYLAQQMGIPEEQLEQEFQDQCLTYNDPRLPNVIKGYVLQSLFYQLEGFPFCSDKGCRLYNAHRQAELIYAQLASPSEFCSRHAAILERIKKSSQ